MRCSVPPQYYSGWCLTFVFVCSPPLADWQVSTLASRAGAGDCDCAEAQDCAAHDGPVAPGAHVRPRPRGHDKLRSRGRGSRSSREWRRRRVGVEYARTAARRRRATTGNSSPAVAPRRQARDRITTRPWWSSADFLAAPRHSTPSTHTPRFAGAQRKQQQQQQ